jgi:type I restriction enzyme S subunit
VPLSAVCEILDSRRIPVNSTERNGRIAGKRSDALYPYYGATGKVGTIDGYLFEGEHILIGEDCAPFLEPTKEKAYIADGRFWVNNHAHILKAHASNRFLRYFLNAIDYSEHVSGTTRLKLTQAALRDMKPPVSRRPPN